MTGVFAWTHGARPGSRPPVALTPRYSLFPITSTPLRFPYICPSAMSRTARGTFYGSIVFAAITIAGVHYAQKVENAVSCLDPSLPIAWPDLWVVAASR